MSNLAQGGILMLIGMLMVSGFLLLMVFAMMLSAAFCRKFAHLFPEEERETNIGKIAKDHSDIALVLAAVKAHTSNKDEG